MKRRHLLSAAAAAPLAASLPLRAASRPAIRLDLITAWPAALDNLFGTAQYFARRLEAVSEGQVQCRVHPAGARVGALEVYDAIASGAYAIGHTAPYYQIGKSPAHGFFTALPFGLGLHQQNAWMRYGNGQAFWDLLNARDGLVAYPGGNTGPQTGGWFNREIERTSDLRGLRMRFPGHGGRVMARTGVTIQQLPAGEVYTAMSRGLLDAAEWVGPHDDRILGMHRVSRYLYLPSWAEPSAMLGFYFNRRLLRELPHFLQAAIPALCCEADAWMTARYQALNPPALQALQDDPDVSIRRFPESVLDAFADAAATVHAEDSKRSALYREIHADWQAFGERMDHWDRETRIPYDRYRLQRAGRLDASDAG